VFQPKIEKKYMAGEIPYTSVYIFFNTRFKKKMELRFPMDTPLRDVTDPPEDHDSTQRCNDIAAGSHSAGLHPIGHYSQM
jgi:hypothetical protein